MAEREVLALNETTPQVLAPQSGDTYKMPRSLSVTGNVTVSGTVDGRDVSVDGTKLDGIEALADVTDATNVNAAGAVMESDYDAQTLLRATLDNTPTALTVGEQTVVGRITSGNITALTAAEVRTLINVENGATADQSASEILAALLTVDGPGSLLDADLLDGNSAAAFATSGQANATHTGDASGATVLTLQPAAIAGKSLVTVAATDQLLILDDSASPNALKRIVASDFAVAGHSHTAPEGTAVLSTGEVGGTKFLREDGDGTSSWQTVAAATTVATDVIWDAAGDIVQGTGANTAARLALGTTLQQLRVNAGATALEYFTPAAAGDFKADGSVDMSGQFRTDVGTFDSDVVNGATANAYTFDTQNTYSTAGANLLRLSNNATTVFDFSYQGGIDHVNSGASTAAHSQSLNLNWTSTSTKTSSGLYSAVIGSNNTSSGLASFCAGEANVVSDRGSIALGELNTSSKKASIALGYQCTSAADYGGMATGLYANNTIVGAHSQAGGKFSADGDAQGITAVVRKNTTDATQTALDTHGTTRMVIPADTTWAFSALIVARSDEADGNNCAIYKIEGGLKRDESSNTALVGTPTVTVIAEDTDAIPWSVVAEADDTNEALAIKVTGEAATNIRWVAKVDIAQVTYA